MLGDDAQRKARMPLSLIVGPPNSGRAGAVRERLTAALGRDPVLVVPTLEDASRFERELCTSGNAVLGASILTFERLFEEVARATGAAVPPPLTTAQSQHLARRAIASTGLRILARSARRPGFAAALATLIDELQASCLDPRTVVELSEDSDDPRYLGELAALYGAYVALRDELGFGDSHVAAAVATAALRASRDAWGPRPVLLYGFDDMTVEQIELVGALGDVTEVTVTVTFEDREALAARSSLRGELVERGGEIVDERRPDPAHTDSEILYHLERGFLGGSERRAVDPGLVLMESAGERGQAEQIGVEIAHLLAAGARADEIAVVLRNPDRDGPLYESVFASLGIPVAAEARIPVGRTAVGRGLSALLRATHGSRGAADLLAFLRTPGRGHADQVDWLERSIRRHGLSTADGALEAWRGRDLFELQELGDAAGPRELLLTLSRLARTIAEYPYERDAPHPARERSLELRAAAVAATALEELAALSGIEDGPAEALACLETLEVPLWRGPSDGHVRVTSPYRIRARRVEYLFVASLQEGEFPRRDPGEPLLSDEQRAELSVPPRAEAADEERYLFYVCLSRPTRRLHLCWRSCDDEGAPAARSPLLDDVRDLLLPTPPRPDQPDPLDSEIRRRTLADVTLLPDSAPTPDELARALAASPRRNGVEIPAGLELEHPLVEALRGRLDRAAELAELCPGPIRTPAVLDALRERELFGASTLEGYALCSYRWFVDHELGPQRLDPDPDPLLYGSMIHRVLEELYRNPPGPDPRPRPDSLGAWRRRAAELTASFAADDALGGDDPRSAAARARVEALVGGFLGREAQAASPLRPHPELIEASFGRGEDDAKPALDLGGFALHGKIDRVDLTAGDEPAGLIRDYKASRVVTPAAKLAEQGKLQLPLYALALARVWGVRPLGAIYEPLGATDDPRPRGFVRRDDEHGALEGLDLVARDRLDDDAFEEILSDTAGAAAEIVEAMREGRIDRDPIDDECPRYCTFQAICRRERAARQVPSAADEEEEPEA
jgi:ATP-dependent helicase/DNAse subunit B